MILMDSGKTKEFSIIIMTYNRKSYLEKCLKSVFAQDYPKSKYEIIVVDDGSTDGTEKFVKSLLKKHKNLKYIKHPENKGVAAARNTGIKNSKGEFVCMLADDYVLPRGFVKKALDVSKKTGAKIITNSFFCDQKSVIAQGFHAYYVYYIDRALSESKRVNLKGFVLYDTNLSVSGAAVVKKDVFSEAGFFNEKLKRTQDSEFRYRVMEKGIKIYYSKDNPIKKLHPESLFSSLKQNYNQGTWYFSYLHYARELLESELKHLLRFFIGQIFTFLKRTKRNPMRLKLIILLLEFAKSFGVLVGFLDKMGLFEWRRKSYRVIALTPIYDEEKYLRRFLKENEKFVDGFVFLDDCSTDNSYNIVKNHPKTLKVIRKTKRKGFDDRGNRDKLLKVAEEINSKWFLFIDADEILDKNYLNDFRRLLRISKADIVLLRLVHLWGSEKTYREDYPHSKEGVQYKKRLFRKRDSMKIRSNKILHTGLIPYNNAIIKSSVVLIKHLSNISKEERVERYKEYVREFDKDLSQQKSYEHFLDDEVKLSNVNKLYNDKIQRLKNFIWRKTI